MGTSARMLGPRVDFEFAFNDTVFSDRVLRIEVMADSLDSDFDGFNCVPSSKHQRREDLDQDKIGDEAAHSKVVNKVETLLISSPILAASSPFFYKLFKNGMIESQHDHVTLRIDASEEAALMDLLKFIYTNTLSATTTTDLLNVLIAADKYEVISCMTYCVELLQKLPMSLESACLHLDLPSSVLMAEAVQPLKDAAKLYLAYLDHFNKSHEEMMALPLSALEVVLGSDGLQVFAEEQVFDFILKWARAHYPILEERQEILTKRLVRFICFPYMTNSKLKQVLVCPDFDHKQVSDLVNEALLLKGELPYGKGTYMSNNLDCLTQASVQPIKRFYILRPITMVQFKCTRPRCVVYFNLTKEECESLESRKFGSQVFRVDGKMFFLLPECYKDQLTLLHHFALAVYTSTSSLGNWTVDCEFAVMKKPLEEFEIKYKVNDCMMNNSTVPGDKSVIKILAGKQNLFGIPWTDFMSNDSEYFINGILHLRVQLTLNKK